MDEQQRLELTRNQTLSCIECARGWLDSSEKWRLYLTDDYEPEAVLYCPLCASYEFDAP